MPIIKGRILNYGMDVLPLIDSFRRLALRTLKYMYEDLTCFKTQQCLWCLPEIDMMTTVYGTEIRTFNTGRITLLKGKLLHDSNITASLSCYSRSSTEKTHSAALGSTVNRNPQDKTLFPYRYPCWPWGHICLFQPSTREKEEMKAVNSTPNE